MARTGELAGSDYTTWRIVDRDAPETDWRGIERIVDRDAPETDWRGIERIDGIDESGLPRWVPDA